MSAEYNGKTYNTKLSDILSEVNSEGAMQIIVKNNIITTVNGRYADYEKNTAKWGIKINWGDSLYDPENIEICNHDVIWLNYEQEVW